MTTNYPSGPTPTGPAGPDYVPADRDDRAGCAWGWWILILIIIIVIVWWAGWGWGPSGGYWFRTRPANQPGTMQPTTRPTSGATTQPVGGTTFRQTGTTELDATAIDFSSRSPGAQIYF